MATPLLTDELRWSTLGTWPFWRNLAVYFCAFSLVGQFWQNRRHVAAWWMWIAVDLIYIGMFVNKQLFVTALLYTGFVGLAVKGLRDWQRAAQAEAASTPRPSAS